MSGPKLTGSPHLLFFLSYFEYQISFPPCPPGILEQKNKVVPSGDKDGAAYLMVSLLQNGSNSPSPHEFPFLVATYILL